jgi:hypothetical protein
LASLDSAFQLQEYISLLIRLDVHDVETIVSIPGKKDANEEGKEKEKDNTKDAVVVDEHCWIYEQLRCVQSITLFPDMSNLYVVDWRRTCLTL